MTIRGVIRLILIAVLLCAFWLRVHQLEQFPAGLHFDEAANAILSSEIAFDGYRPIFISSYTGKEAFFFYAAGLLMNRIGSSIFALRLTAGFFGLLTIAATYQLGARLLRDRRVALIAAILLAINFAHLLFSRLGFRAISQPLTQALTILFLIDGFRRLERQQPAWWFFGAAGLFLGLTAHTYLAARLFPVALAIPLIMMLFAWGKQHQFTELFKGLGFVGLVGAVVLLPLLFWFFQNPEAFWVRIGQVGASDGGISTLDGLRRAVAMLFWNGDPYVRFNIPGRPLFFPLTIFAAALGIWQLLKQITNRDAHEQFGRWVLIIVPLVMLLPTALATSEIVPSNLRAIGIFPFVVFWPAVGIIWLLDV
ncbi:MAG: glycosyltransferase family 39 protein, partial [Chloroflexota bacterium]